MLYSDEFIESVRLDPVRGTIRACEIAIDALQFDESRGWTDAQYEVLLQAFALISELAEAGLLPLQLSFPSIAGTGVRECKMLVDWLSGVKQAFTREQNKLQITSLRTRFRASLSTGFFYEFSQGDLERVQALVNELRDEIAAAGSLEADHKRRLLNRLESLQREMHKKVSDLDRFWGLVGDAGVVLGKIGTDAKPIVDRIREIADIVWRTQSRAEELPSGTKLPQLESDGHSSKEA